MRRCPALMLCAPASGQGKTLISSALAAWYRQRGLRVRTFKFGPDYLDPLQLSAASGSLCLQLDPWMAGEEACRRELYEAAGASDVILLEGAMGMFDGKPSAADLALRLHLPVAAVIDASGMAQSFAALAKGLATHRPQLHFAGVIANRVAGQRHLKLLQEQLPDSLPLLAWMPRDAELTMPVRHLGLVAPEETLNAEARFQRAAERIVIGAELRDTPPPASFAPAPRRALPADASLHGIRIGVARDAAFSFLYPANLALLEELGAQLQYFSPLCDPHLPNADALWLPGGYPELHLDALQKNHSLAADLRAHHNAGRPLLAECGGMLYALETLRTRDGQQGRMAALMPGNGALRDTRGCQGMQTALLPEGEVRAHAHHHSHTQTPLTPFSHGRRQNNPAPGEPLYRHGSLTATYLHLYFPSNPGAVARLFGGE